MELKDIIYRRKSVRSYSGKPVGDITLAKIETFSASLKPLYPEIKVHSEIVSREQVKCILPWITPQLIAIYTEETDGALENVGFMFQQLELYMQSLGIGVCWLGMGRMRHEVSNGLKFAMLLAFGHPKEISSRRSAAEFNRKPIAMISDNEDSRLEPARLAPSSVNSQPWYFTHDGDNIHVHCVMQGVFKSRPPGRMNLIDIGIALAHMYVAHPDTFSFFKSENVTAVKGFKYIGSFKL